MAVGAADLPPDQVPPSSAPLATSNPTPDPDTPMLVEPSVGAGAGAGGSAEAPALRRAVRALLAEHAMHPDGARTHGAGLLLAEAALGVSNGLHSR